MDTSIVGREYAPFVVEVEKRWLRSFAQAVGEAGTVYVDEGAARAAGYESLPAPPTFAFVLAMEANQSFMVLDDLGIDKTRSMHGEQSFVYHRALCAGDTVTGRQKVIDMYEKKGGALQFIVTETRLQNQRGEPVCDMRTTIVVRAA